MPCCGGCASGHKCEGENTMDDMIPKAIAAAIPAAMYDTLYRGSSLSQAIPLAVAAGVSNAIGDMLTKSFVGPMLGYDHRILTPLVSGAVFYSAANPLRLFSPGVSTMSKVAEGALYSFAGNMVLPQVRGLLSFAGTPGGGAVMSTVLTSGNTY